MGSGLGEVATQEERNWLVKYKPLEPFPPWHPSHAACLSSFGLLKQKYHRLSDLKTFISHSFGGWEVQGQGTNRCGVWWELQIHKIAIFLLCSRMEEGVGELSGVFFIKALMSFMRAPLLWPNHLPKALLPNTITLGNSISTYEF